MRVGSSWRQSSAVLMIVIAALAMSGVAACTSGFTGASARACDTVAPVGGTSAPISTIAPASTNATPLFEVPAPYTAQGAWSIPYRTLQRYATDPQSDSFAGVFSTSTGLAVALWQRDRTDTPRWYSQTIITTQRSTPVEVVRLGFFRHHGELWIGLGLDVSCTDSTTETASLEADILFSWKADQDSPTTPVAPQRAQRQHPHNADADLRFVDAGLASAYSSGKGLHEVRDDVLLTPDGAEKSDFGGAPKLSQFLGTRSSAGTQIQADPTDIAAVVLATTAGHAMATLACRHDSGTSTLFDFANGMSHAAFSPDGQRVVVPFSEYRGQQFLSAGIGVLSTDPAQSSRCYDGDYSSISVDNDGTVLAQNQRTETYTRITADGALTALPRQVQIPLSTSPGGPGFPEPVMTHSAVFNDHGDVDILYWLARR